MSGKGDRNRSTKAFQQSSYFCETCSKGPSACRCKCPECREELHDKSSVPSCSACGWFDEEAKKAGIRAVAKLSPMERQNLMFSRMSVERKVNEGPKYPSCFGSDPSPSNEAENSCHDCPHRKACITESRRSEPLEFGGF